MAAASFRHFCRRFHAETRQVSANKTPARIALRRFNARIECIANALPKPRGYPVHLHPLRGNIFPHCNPQTRPRKCPGTPSPRDGAVRALYRRLCTPPSPIPPPASRHKRRRCVLAGYTKLFKWDLLDGTLPNALPASSRSTASYKIQNPEELIFYERQ